MIKQYFGMLQWLNGDGVPKNEEEASRLYKFVSDKGNDRLICLVFNK